MTYLLLNGRKGVAFFDLFLLPTLVICFAVLCLLYLVLTKKVR